MEKLTIVIPAFNEEAVLPSTISRLLKIEAKLIEEQLLEQTTDILIVDDGSTDQTWNIIKKKHIKMIPILPELNLVATSAIKML